MQTKDRHQLAQIYRAKSDESMAAALDCLERAQYRSCCNRAWYAIFQAVVAGTYERLNQNPPRGRTWDHASVEALFAHFLRSAKLRLRYWYLVECMATVRTARERADYEFDPEPTSDEAAASVLTAQRVRDIIYEILEWTKELPRKQKQASLSE